MMLRAGRERRANGDLEGKTHGISIAKNTLLDRARGSVEKAIDQLVRCPALGMRTSFRLAALIKANSGKAERFEVVEEGGRMHICKPTSVSYA